jgi:PAS domain-containing protein
MTDRGHLVKIAGTMMDETERVETERVRIEAEAQFEIGFEQSANANGNGNANGSPVRVNAAACALLGRVAVTRGQLTSAPAAPRA